MCEAPRATETGGAHTPLQIVSPWTPLSTHRRDQKELQESVHRGANPGEGSGCHVGRETLPGPSLSCLPYGTKALMWSGGGATKSALLRAEGKLTAVGQGDRKSISASGREAGICAAPKGTGRGQAGGLGRTCPWCPRTWHLSETQVESEQHKRSQHPPHRAQELPMTGISGILLGRWECAKRWQVSVAGRWERAKRPPLRRVQGEDLTFKIKQTSLWQIKFHSKHKALLQECEAWGALRVTIATTNLKSRPTPNWVKSNIHTKHLSIGKACSCLGVKTLPQSLLTYTRCPAFKKKIIRQAETSKKENFPQRQSNRQNQTQIWNRC